MDSAEYEHLGGGLRYLFVHFWDGDRLYRLFLDDPADQTDTSVVDLLCDPDCGHYCWMDIFGRDAHRVSDHRLVTRAGRDLHLDKKAEIEICLKNILIINFTKGRILRLDY